VRNILVVNERRKRISEADTASFLRALSSLGILVDHSPDEGAVLSLARKHRLSIYDAAYLELAQREVVPLATLDAGIIRAARTERVTIIGEK
jgi:predicted nucleic acid-binding protein